MTPLQIINLALKIDGVAAIGQTPLSEEVNDAFLLLNTMVAVWTRKRWLVYHLVDISCLGTGQTAYSIGPNQQFNVIRPDEVEGAYVRLLKAQTSTTVDYPLNIIASHEDYANITLKNLVSFPVSLFYDSNYPVGTIYVWPAPSSDYEIHILLKENLNQFPDLTTNVNLPPEYIDALIWNLAIRLRPLYGLPPELTIITNAKTTLSTIRGANSQISQLSLPAGLSRNRSAGGNYHTGGVREGTFTLDEDLLG